MLIESKTVIYETHHQPDFIFNRIPDSQQEFFIPISLLEYIGLHKTLLARTPHRVFEIGPSVRGSLTAVNQHLFKNSDIDL